MNGSAGELARLLGRMKQGIQRIMAGSVWAVLIILLGGFGLFWLGIAVHWALVPVYGSFWAWLIPAAVYLLLAGVIAVAAFRSSPRSGMTAGAEGGGVKSQQVHAERLGMELGMELGAGLEQELRRHPLRAVSLAVLGGAVLGASPRLRRSLFGLLGEREETAAPRRF